MSNIIDFINKYTTIPNTFITDFIKLTENNAEYKFVVSFDILCKWLDILKRDLKKSLVRNFEVNYDYHIIISTSPSHKQTIMLTADCCKELCMLSRCEKSSQVRKYFIEMEKLIKTYYSEINESMMKQINVIKTNQKPKINVIGGTIYIIKAQNNISHDVYKMGKTNNIKKRMNVYNTANSNDIEVIFVQKVDNIDAVENCVKSMAKRFQYRSKKEIYEVDIEVLKGIIDDCCNIDIKISANKIDTKSKYFVSIEK
jgi:phage anti-repressor protein